MRAQLGRLGPSRRGASWVLGARVLVGLLSCPLVGRRESIHAELPCPRLSRNLAIQPSPVGGAIAVPDPTGPVTRVHMRSMISCIVRGKR